jgi:hypothetical protein
VKQYLLSVHNEANPEPVPPEEMQKMYERTAAYNTEVQDEGAWVFAGGLHPPSTATVVRASQDADPMITDGPYAETKEYIGGFWVLRAPDLDAALALAARASLACGAPVEVRPFQEETGD